MHACRSTLEDPTLELPDLRAYFLDLAVLPDAATLYRLLVRELRGRGETPQALAEALDRAEYPVLICADGADAAITAGWGADALERLARLARSSTPSYAGGTAPLGPGLHDLMLVVAAGATPPLLSEPFAPIVLGAIAPAEVRLLAEAYLDDSGESFSPGELRELGALSAGHPAYLQRAAYHLFEARRQTDYNWRAAYLAEARERPVPGAPLPPEAFVGEGDAGRAESRYGEIGPAARPAPPPELRISGLGDLLAAIGPVIAALVVFQISGSWLLALLVLGLGYAAGALSRSRSRQR